MAGLGCKNSLFRHLRRAGQRAVRKKRLAESYPLFNVRGTAISNAASTTEWHRQSTYFDSRRRACGFERFDEGEAPKLTPFWKKSAAEPAPAATAGWATAPFEPNVTLRFARADYLEVLQNERRRLATQQ